jgi:hypothetical protein
VADEYRANLVIDAGTKWQVSAELRRQIEQQ